MGIDSFDEIISKFLHFLFGVGKIIFGDVAFLLLVF